MRVGITVKAGAGLRMVGTPVRNTPRKAGIVNPRAASNVKTASRSSNFTEEFS
jgi:hypothetical protein